MTNDLFFYRPSFTDEMLGMPFW